MNDYLLMLIVTNIIAICLSIIVFVEIRHAKKSLGKVDKSMEEERTSSEGIKIRMQSIVKSAEPSEGAWDHGVQKRSGTSIRDNQATKG